VENARFFEKAGAAVIIGPGGAEEKAAALEKAVVAIAGDSGLRDAMAAASAKIGLRDGTALIARAILETVGGDNAGH
jgi:UDP-N-acetylglucosamine:LPS N-acetylglucosamine transferase